MTPERWQRVKAVVADAMERAVQERAAFVSSACADDTSLRLDVESLLNQSHETLDRCAAKVAARSLEVDPMSGARFGAYEVVRELGRGGMGAVYLARRADDEFEKLVAIKLLKRGTDTDEVLRRFRAERQILARLEHPNIAHLLDAGTTDDELPYFVMEYVAGERITEFCSARTLSVRARVELVLKVCSAVQFAHRNLVVHRDLKPGNILVTADGEPKLLDFGIAKLLAPDSELTGATLTLDDQQRLTPGYASPEQVRGEAVTTVSDVYSLGALLYELVAGEPPHRFSSSRPSPTELFQVVVEQESRRASAAASAPERRRELRGDLDNILLTALRKEPERRYSGVTALADDLRRFLEQRPVRARPATLSYRASRFVRRNKVAVAAAAIVLLGGVAAANVYFRQAQREAASFRDLRNLANLFIFKYHDAISALPGSTELRKELVKDALAYLNNLAAKGNDDPDLLRELGTAYKRIGDVQGGILINEATGLTISAANLGDTAGALDSYTKALALRRQVASLRPNDPRIQLELAESHTNLGEVAADLGEPAKAASYYREAISMFQSLIDQDANNKAALTSLQTSSSALGGVLAVQTPNLGDIAGGLAAMRKAIAVGETLLAAEPHNSARRQSLAPAYGDTGRILFNDGQYEEALGYYRKALVIGETLLSENPTDRLFRREVAVQHRNVGGASLRTGQTAVALEHFRAAISIFEQLAKEDPNDARTRRSSAYGYRDLGEALAANGDHPEAEGNFATALRIFEELAAKDPKNALLSAQQGITHLKMSGFFADSGDSVRALTSAQRSAEIAQSLIAANPEDTGARKTLAEAYAQISRLSAQR